MKENIIEKIKKLRALSSSSNLNEATTAARMAEKLIQEYQIAEAEIELNGGETETPLLDQNPLTDWGQRQNRWQNMLSTALCEAYNCSNVFQRKNNASNIYVIGRPSDIEIVRYNFAYLVLEISRLAGIDQPKHLIKGEAKGWRNSFYLGAVDTIVAALKKEKEEVKQQASSSALAVLNSHMQDTLALEKKLFPDNKTIKMNSRIDVDAYRKGQAAGSNLQSKPSLPGGPKLLKD